MSDDPLKNGLDEVRRKRPDLSAEIDVQNDLQNGTSALDDAVETVEKCGDVGARRSADRFCLEERETD